MKAAKASQSRVPPDCLAGLQLAGGGGRLQRRSLGGHEGGDGPGREEPLLLPALLQRRHGAAEGERMVPLPAVLLPFPPAPGGGASSNKSAAILGVAPGSVFC